MTAVIPCSPKRIARFLIFVELGLLLASVAAQLCRYIWKLELSWMNFIVWLLNVDGEKNIPSLYSAAILLVCAILLATITFIKKINRERDIFHWGALAAIFCLLSVDEWFSLHEKMGERLSLVITTSGIFHYAWVIPGSAFVLILAIAYLKFFTRLPKTTRRLVLTAAGIFISGAIGMELVAGYYASTQTSWSRGIWMLLTTIEEALEMAGTITFIYALLSYMSAQIQELRIRIGESEIGRPSNPSNPEAQQLASWR